MSSIAYALWSVPDWMLPLKYFGRLGTSLTGFTGDISRRPEVLADPAVEPDRVHGARRRVWECVYLRRRLELS